MITLLRALLTASTITLVLSSVMGCGSPGAASGAGAAGASSMAEVQNSRPPEILSLLTTEEYDRMLEMNPTQARARYGQTIEGYLCQDCEFTLTPSIELFRFELLTRFSKEEIESESIRIREMTWRVDAFRNLTIWYWIHSFGLRPIHQMVWNRTWRFEIEDELEK
ncbi:MAG: hypothetical protein LBM75_09515 [Myxococcales bacterium]|nr:hypothetical protein [Myxococcales bacterium]